MLTKNKKLVQKIGKHMASQVNKRNLMKKQQNARTQLKHLDGAPDAKSMALSPIAGGEKEMFQAEAKGGDGAEVMSFK